MAARSQDSGGGRENAVEQEVSRSGGTHPGATKRGFFASNGSPSQESRGAAVAAGLLET